MSRCKLPIDLFFSGSRFFVRSAENASACYFERDPSQHGGVKK
jgi:hypothetical protein